MKKNSSQMHKYSTSKRDSNREIDWQIGKCMDIETRGSEGKFHAFLTFTYI